MKKLIILSVILNLISLSAFAEDCLQAYKDSSKEKADNYQRDLDKYNSIGRSELRVLVYADSEIPKWDNYNIFEKDIISAVEFDLKSEKDLSKPMVLDGIYTAAQEKYSGVTYQRIQDIMLKGFLDKRFCSIFGKARVPRIQRYVLNQLKKESNGSAYVRGPAIYDTKDDDKSLYEELDRPLSIPEIETLVSPE